MKFGSVCSGIEAASAAWEPLGWSPQFFAEIEKFPSQVLKVRYPHVPNLGDMTKFKEWPDANIDVLIGGTPCQSFSVAGLRKGLDDPRGNLALTFLAIADRYRPRWVVWENVPGVHSSWTDEATGVPPQAHLERIESARRDFIRARDLAAKAGVDLGGEFSIGSDEFRARDFEECVQTSDFDCFITGLEELGYGVATRVLDAQYFGVAQRRRRVFVVGCLGDWRGAAAVLFDRQSVSGNTPPSRQTREGSTHGVAPSLTASGRGVERAGETRGQDPVVAVSPTITAKWAKGTGGPAGDECGNLVAHTLRGEGYDATEDGSGRGTPLIAVIQDGREILKDQNGLGVSEDDTAYTIDTTGAQAVAFNPQAAGDQTRLGFDPGADTAGTLATGSKQAVAIAFNSDQSEKTRSMGERNDQTPTLRAGGEVSVAIAWDEEMNAREEQSGTVLRGGDGGGDGGRHAGVMTPASQVRRLTPRECERLQGFPDDYTLIQVRGKPAADGPRYKALGNSMAVPVIKWIGQRIEIVDTIMRESE